LIGGRSLRVSERAAESLCWAANDVVAAAPESDPRNPLRVQFATTSSREQLCPTGPASRPNHSVGSNLVYTRRTGRPLGWGGAIAADARAKIKAAITPVVHIHKNDPLPFAVSLEGEATICWGKLLLQPALLSRNCGCGLCLPCCLMCHLFGSKPCSWQLVSVSTLRPSFRSTASSKRPRCLLCQLHSVFVWLWEPLPGLTAEPLA
jgi:hypothetical protein